MLYEDVFREFERQGIRYFVVGGIAVNLHGYARLTVDLDIMMDLSEQNLAKLVQSMERLGYSPRIPVKPADLVSKERRDAWIEQKGAIVFTFVNVARPSRQVDVFLSNPIEFQNAYNRRQTREVSGVRIPIASIDDIIALKSLTTRPRDKEDIEHLEHIKKLK